MLIKQWGHTNKNKDKFVRNFIVILQHQEVLTSCGFIDEEILDSVTNCWLKLESVFIANSLKLIES